MWVNGKTIYNKDTEQRNGQMGQNMKGISTKVSSKEQVLTFGKMAPNTMECGLTINDMDKGQEHGLMAKNMQENGLKILCMVMEL